MKRIFTNETNITINILNKMKLDDLFLFESSGFNKITKHINDPDTESWAILTSWRAENTPEQNKSDFKELKNTLKSKKLGFIQMEGVGQEKDPATKKTIQVKEPSLFVPNISLEQAQKIRKKYDQFAIVYSGIETDHMIMLIEKSRKTNLGKFRPNKIGQFFSKVSGKTFTFS